MGAAPRLLPEPRDAPADAIRTLRPEHIPDIVELRQQVFRFSERGSRQALAEYFQRMFLGDAVGGSPPSLVLEDGRGQVAGFLGVVPRSMEFRARRLRVAVATQFMVRPGTPGLAGVRLARALVDGSHDLILADNANEAARRIWLRTGGHTSAVHSVFWSRSLRPFRDTARRMARGLLSRALVRAGRPLLGALDGVRPTEWSQPVARGETGELDSGLMLSQFAEICGRRSLRPLYHDGSLDRVLDLVAEKRLFGELHRAAVWSARGVLAGWFLYFASGGGVAQVAQVAARDGAEGLVLDHLFHHAWRTGAVAVSGRLEPTLLPALAARGCTFDRDGPWMLIRARDPEVVHAIEVGDAFLSRLEGEWWMSF